MWTPSKSDLVPFDANSSIFYSVRPPMLIFKNFVVLICIGFVMSG